MPPILRSFLLAILRAILLASIPIITTTAYITTHNNKAYPPFDGLYIEYMNNAGYIIKENARLVQNIKFAPAFAVPPPLLIAPISNKIYPIIQNTTIIIPKLNLCIVLLEPIHFIHILNLGIYCITWSVEESMEKN